MNGLLPKRLDTFDQYGKRPLATGPGVVGVAVFPAVQALVGVVASVAPAGAQSPEPSGSVASPEAATPGPSIEPTASSSLGVGSPTMSAERDGLLLEASDTSAAPGPRERARPAST